MIDKQRRGWEEAREKAEQMSQIFDSLIITNDRPYVSCGLELPATCPGLIDFAQFELINKVPVKQSRKHALLINVVLNSRHPKKD